MSRTYNHSRLERELQRRREIEYELHHKKEELKATNKLIKEIRNDRGVIITNHAIIRYVQRVLKIDIEEIKDKILTDKVLDLHDKLGNGKYPNDGFHVVIVDNFVKTVI